METATGDAAQSGQTFTVKVTDVNREDIDAGAATEGLVMIASGAADMTLVGGAGDDYLSGATGDDTLRGGDGNDRIHDNQGRDVIEGGSGDDDLRGGTGAHEFLFAPGHGNDTISYFGHFRNAIVVSAALVGTATNGAEVIAMFAVTSSGVAVPDFGSETITFSNLTHFDDLADNIFNA